MSASIKTVRVPTSHGTLSTSLSTPNQPSNKPTLVLIHGNSSSSRIFHHIFASSLTHSHPILALDLPGHGQSTDSLTPEATYTQPSYAQAVQELLQHFSVASVIILGWSLGGHIGIELIPLLGPSLRGLIIVGTPPIPRGQIECGFVGDPHMSAAFRGELSDHEYLTFGADAVGPPHECWMRADVLRTDGRARRIMFEAFEGGLGLDQQDSMENHNHDVVVAVVNGAADPFIKIDLISTVQFKDLWQEKCIVIEGVGHAPFWEKPPEFGAILEEFVIDVS